MGIGNWLRRNASTILTLFGVGGVVATVVLAVKATPQALEDISEAKTAKCEDQPDEASPELTVQETVLACWKNYIPAASVGIGSVACILGANVLSRKQQASIASAYSALIGVFETYRRKVDAICGAGTDEIVERATVLEQQDKEDGFPPWEELQTFHIQGYPEFFERTMEEVMQAEYHINRNFVLKGEVTLNELFDFLHLPHIENGDHDGWDVYEGETVYGYQWIDFRHRHYVTDDHMMVCDIEMPFAPHHIK